jgi:outer membrane protein assembly factor BamB
MKSYPALRRGLAVVATLAVFAVVVALAWSGRNGREADAPDKKPDPKFPWPIYGGSLSRNMVNTFDKNIPAEWKIALDDKGHLDEKESKNIKWAADLGSKAYGGPILAGGKIFIGTNNGNPRDKTVVGDKGILMCFEEATGKFLWQIVHDKLPAGQVWDWPEEGICSSPVVEGDRLWYVNNRCEVVCATTDGKIDWKYDMMKELGVFPHNLATCSPMLIGDTLFLVTSNGVDEGHINIPAPKAPSFLALEKKTGKKKWDNNFPSAALLKNPDSFKQLADRGLILMHGQWSNPVYAEVNGKGQVIFPGGDGWLYSFEPETGKLVWKFDCNPKDATYELGGRGTRNDFIATPVVVDGKCYIAVGQDPEHKKSVGHLWCIDVTKGKDGMDVSPELAEWKVDPEHKDGKLITTPNKNSAVGWHFGGMNDPKNPHPKLPKGRRYLFGRSMSTCAVQDGLVYTADLDGFVYCFDAKTGVLHWVYDWEKYKADCWCSPSWIDGKVFIGNDKGFLVVLGHGKEKKVLSPEGKPIDMGGRVRTASVAANGVLYVMTEDKLYAIQEKK